MPVAPPAPVTEAVAGARRNRPPRPAGCAHRWSGRDEASCRTATLRSAPPKAHGRHHEGNHDPCHVLIGLHAAAALYHHYILRDNTLRRMLPRRP